ncbi:MAG TPA: ABC transporter permease [Solirubrobacteraceae bacterium]|nr:ABC transporter permease [Solirubrobacteraceae bacterium]
MSAAPIALERRWMRARRLPGLRGQGGVIASVAFLVVVTLAAILAPEISPHNPSAADLSSLLSPPGTPGHLLGTDTAGRDILSRIIYGARISLLAPLVLVVISSTLGTAIGVCAGWMGGIADEVISRVMDFLFAFPGLLIAIIAVALFGTGVTAPIVGLIIAYTPYTARLARGLVAQERNLPYVESYRQQGFSGPRIALTMLLPNIAPTLLAQSALSFGYGLIDLATLSFLGFGVQPPTADWGVMVSDAQQGILQGDIWVALFPGLAIMLTVISFNVLGDAIAERIGRTEAA